MSDGTAKTAPPLKEFFCKKRPASFGFILLGVATSVCTLFAYLGDYWWIFDLFAHFRVQYLMALFVAIAGLGWFRMNKTLAIFSLFALGNIVAIFPLLFGANSLPPEGREITVISANVNTANRQYDKLEDYVLDKKPDIVALLEVSDTWDENLPKLKAAYPHQIKRLRTDNFGIAVYSRLPFDKTEIRTFGETDVPTIVVSFDLPEGHLTFVAAHPVPPPGAALSNERNQQLAAMAEFVANQDGNCIIVGDLNITPWSPHYQNMLEVSGLRNSADGFGVQTTWPDRLLLFPLRIPIDHCLISPNIGVKAWERGPTIGSDHFPIDIQLVLPAPTHKAIPTQAQQIN